MNTKKELISVIAQYFGKDEELLRLLPINVSGSMSCQIEEGLDGSIFRLQFTDSGKTIIVKMKNNSFIANVGETMNYTNSQKFRNNYLNGYGLFYTRDCFCREKYIYTLLDKSLIRYVPKYYGSIDVSDQECLHLMEDIDIIQNPVNNDYVSDFLSDLHSVYYNDFSSAKSMIVNMPMVEDYRQGVLLSRDLFDNIKNIYLDFPRDILESIRLFYEAPNQMYKQLLSFPRTICHGDFAIRNISFLKNQLAVYDWELSTFNNPEFDLVSFLTFYPDDLTEAIVDSVLKGYYEKMKKKRCVTRIEYDVKKALLFNTLLLMCTRFHAMMNISMRVNMPFMNKAIGNWLFLYIFFANKQKGSDQNVIPRN